MNYGERDKRVLWHPFTAMSEWEASEPLVIVGADGAYLLDDSGRRYFDGVSSLWVTVHGHNHPRIVEAIARQAGALDHSTMLGLTHPRAVELAEKLVAMTPASLTRVFYSDSGSTAVEIALKQAFQYWAQRGEPRRQRFVHLAEAYHGDTLGAVGVGGIELFHRVFGPLIVAGVPVRSPSPRRGESPAAALEAGLMHLDKVLAAHDGELAAMVLEPLVQGAAGMLVHPPGYLREAARRCREAGVLLIADEVATGFGRTGSMFACEQEGVEPDFLCLAKGLTGGTLPLAATLTTEEVYSAFLGPRAEEKTFFHGHTYTGNPIACAAALASLELMTPAFLEHVRRIGHWMEEALGRLGDMPDVAEVRQRGVMAGIELVRPDGTRYPAAAFHGSVVCASARDQGVILRPLGDVVVWMPPLCATRADIDLLERATRTAIEACR